jgi:NAD(P)-dependent dehydrogenase (short-subunit alcohol dehydrogenase family)
VLVTGGASGIGRAVADGFHVRGAQVCVLDLDEVPDAPAGWLIRRGSVADRGTVEAAFAAMDEAWGGVDVAHANAGIGTNKPTLDLSEAEWRCSIDVNLTGAFLTAQAAARRMVVAQSGLILFTASIYHQLGGAERAAYCAAKGGVANLARALACEFGPLGVRVNAIAPGYVETPLIADLVARGRLDSEALARRSPQRRMLQAREIADMALFLASPAAASINGAVIAVDGGWAANGAP